MWKLAVLIFLSVILVAVSWRSLRVPNSHGFPRFFAWEAMLALILLNAEHWFRDPLSQQQLVSWTLLALSLVPLGFGLRLLRQAGQANLEDGRDANLGWENTTKLIESGIYRYIRHPMYTSLLLLTWGAFVKDPSVPGVILAVVATGFLVVTAVWEEQENRRAFGVEYESYSRRTKRFIPYLV